MPKPWKTPQSKERRKEGGVIQKRACFVVSETDRQCGTPLTPEMLRAAAAAHLADQHTVLWGRAFDLLCEDMDMATDWLTEQVIEVLAELST